jgi:hypothetical protein
MEKCVVRFDNSIKTCVGIFVDLLDIRIIHFQIEYFSAIRAYYMVMRFTASIKTVTAGRCRNPECFADVGKQIQVAVDGSEADIRKFFFYMKIYGISRRMCGCV